MPVVIDRMVMLSVLIADQLAVWRISQA